MAVKPLELLETCIMCPRRGSKICPSCKDARYCSKECQKLDWKNHKIICPSFSEPKPIISDTGIWTVGFGRALLFPGGKEPPSFIWIRTIDMPGYQAWNSQDFFKIGGPDTVHVPRNNYQARDTGLVDGTSLVINTEDDARSDTANLAVQAFARSGRCSRFFKGPIMVTRERTGQGAEDMGDVSYDAPHLQKKHILVTNIACGADLERHDWMKKFGDSVFPGDDPIVLFEGSGIANLLGLPILLRPDMCWDAQKRRYKCEHREHKEEDVGELGWRSPEVAMLLKDINSCTTGIQQAANKMSRFLDVSTGEPGFGASREEYSSMGPVWVTRADGLPLPWYHVEALIGYIRDEVEPLLAQALVGNVKGQVVADRETILNSITRAKFSSYFEEFRDKIATDDQDRAYMVSPYDMTPAAATTMRPFIEEMWEERQASKQILSVART